MHYRMVILLLLFISNVELNDKFIKNMNIHRNQRRDVSLCSKSMLNEIKFKLSLLMFIKQCSIILFTLTLFISSIVLIYNYRRYNKLKDEAVVLGNDLRNINALLKHIEHDYQK